MFIDKQKIYIGGVALTIIIVGIIYFIGFNSDSNNSTNTLIDITPANTQTEPVPIMFTTPPYTPTASSADTAIYTTDIIDPIETSYSIRVFISGQVNNPDVFELQNNARVIDLVNLAGGLTEYADLNRINMAGFLQDADHIIIPAVGEEIEVIARDATNNLQQQQISQPTQAISNLVNINTASSVELQTLPSIGTARAQNIISFRESNGYFRTIQEIQNVSGIGSAIFDSIRDQITVD